MRFKLVIVGIFLGVTAMAVTPKEVFTTQRNAILSESLHECDGYAFGVGRACAVSHSGQSRSIAEDKAELSASCALLGHHIAGQVAFPKGFSETEKAILSDVLVQTLSVSSTVRGVTVLERSWQGEECTVVVAVRKESISGVQIPDFAAVCAMLLSDANFYRGALPFDLMMKVRASQGVLPPTLDRKPWQSQLESASFTGRLKRLPECAGRYPMGSTATPQDEAYAQGMVAYRQNALKEAYEAFLKSAQHAWTYDALNMAGNVARRLGNTSAAVPLLLHAAYLKPDSPHPWVHLGYVARAMGDEALVDACCTAAEARTPDTWTKEQCAQLRQKQKRL